MSGKLEELLERVRSATGPDRELDALILCALLAPEGSKVDQSRFNGAWIIYAPKMYPAGEFRAWDYMPKEIRRNQVITASVDAALALVERILPGKYVMMGLWQTETTKPWARIGNWAHADAIGVTLPLAILAAFLSAKIALSAQGRGE